jgi:hypothetical protein
MCEDCKMIYPVSQGHDAVQFRKGREHMKMKKLNSDDRCAVDLLLEARAEGNGALEECFGKSSASLQKHVRAAEKLFGLLDQMPAAQSPAHLVDRTMKFIKKHEHDVTLPRPAEHVAPQAPGHRPTL